jgi:hypothetical protein
MRAQGAPEEAVIPGLSALNADRTRNLLSSQNKQIPGWMITANE